MLARLGEIAREKGRGPIHVSFIPTKKNRPASDFLEEVGAAYRKPGSDGLQFVFPSAAAAAVRFNPATAKSVPVTPTPGAMESGNASPQLVATDTEVFNRIATDLNEAGRILRLIMSRRRTLRPKQKVEFAAPRSTTEQALAEIWAEVLGLDRIGIHDNFFDLGGHSLLSLRVISRLNEVFKSDLSPVALFEHPTVAGLGAFLEAGSQDQTAVPMPENPENRQQPESSKVDLASIAAVLAQRNDRPSRVASGCPYRMRESWICKRILAPLYRIPRGSFRSLLQILILKLEGGPLFTVTLRKLYAKHHDLHIGDYSGRFDANRIKSKTRIGRYTTIYPTVVVQTADHPRNTVSTNALFYHPALGFAGGYELPRVELEIGNDVWIGHNATILYPTKKIGDGAVIAAGSIVVGDVPPYAIVGGYPSRVLRYRFSKEKIDALLKSRWWEASLEELDPVKDHFARPLEGDKIR
jgi:acetyltransferase-like isoleucine patch superfamily enzyme/acyl carrier protein